MRILAVDPGTRCGWCVRYDDGRMDAGTWDLSPRRFEGGGMRFLRLRAHLSEILDRTKPEMVVFEEVRRHLGTDAAHVYGGIVAVLQEECERRTPKVPYHAIPVGTVKRTATGKGNADKARMLAAANARWKLALSARDDNEADARWIAETAAIELGGAPRAATA